MMITKYIFGLIIVIISLIAILNLNNYFKQTIEKREIKSNILTITDTINFICNKNIKIYHLKIPYLKNINYNITFEKDKVCGKTNKYIFCQRVECNMIKKRFINNIKYNFNNFNCKTLKVNKRINITCKPTIE